MTDPRPARSPLVALLAAALLGFAGGWGLATFVHADAGAVGVGVPSAGEGPDAAPRDAGARLDALARALEDWTARADASDAALRAELSALREAVFAAAPAPLEADSGDRAARAADTGADAPDDAELVRRLDLILEAQQRLLAERATTAAPALPELVVPPGVPTRAFLQALKSRDDAELTNAHLFWPPDRVRDTYGTPDRVEDRGDYIEWIYLLGAEGEQFDFHFVNGLCVTAH